MTRLLLAGAGHAHAIVLEAFAKALPPGIEATVIAPYREQVYSGMVPGYLAGHYARDEIAMDFGRLAQRAGAELVLGSVSFLDPDRRAVRLDDGRQVSFDIASLNAGSLTAPVPGAEHALPVKPLARFLRELRMSRGTRTAVIGGGTGGAEVAMALAHRGLRMTLFAEGSVEGRLGAALRGCGVTVHERCPVERVEPGPRVLAKEVQGVFDQVVLATGALAPPWLLAAGLEVDARGFALVDRALRSVSHPHVFAAGDCATLRDAPHPKSGVYSVRHGAVLARNLAGKPLAEYSPQKRALMLVSCGGQRAIARYGGLEAEGAWLWRWKDSIDRRWIRRFA